MNKIQHIIEDIQEVNIKSGGRFMRSSEIEKMTVKELLELITPNSISLKVRFEGKEKCNHNNFSIVASELSTKMFNLRCADCGKIIE